MCFDLKAAEITEKTETIIKTHQEAMDTISSLNGADVTFSTTFGALALADAEAAKNSGEVTLPALVYNWDKEAREASSLAKQRLNQMWQEAYNREVKSRPNPPRPRFCILF